MHAKITILALLLVTLSACATKLDPFRPEAVAGTNSAMIYIYRPPSIMGRGGALFEVDKKPAGTIKPGGHLKIRVEPGTHAVTYRERAFGLPLWGKSIKLPVRAGESYFVRADWNLEAVVGGTPMYGMSLTLIEDGQATAELQQKP